MHGIRLSLLEEQGRLSFKGIEILSSVGLFAIRLYSVSSLEQRLLLSR